MVGQRFPWWLQRSHRYYQPPALEGKDILLAIAGQAIEGVDGPAGFVAALQPYQRLTVLTLGHRSSETDSVQADQHDA